MTDFVKALRTGPTRSTAFGVVRHGMTHDIPRSMLDFGGWEVVGGERVRLTEPAPEAPLVGMSKAQIVARLTELGVEFDKRASKARLEALLTGGDN